MMEMVEMMNDAEEQEGRMTGNGGGLLEVTGDHRRREWREKR